MLARHARQLVLPEVGAAGQQRLAAARVAVVGCGGLGAPVIQQLAAAGIGHLTLCDDDTIEASNLNRQTLFRSDQLGAKKAAVAAAFVAALNPDVVVVARVERITVPAARRLFAEHDVVVDCSDGFPTKYLLNDCAVVVDKALVHGAATAWAGQVLVVPGRSGPCLRCLFPTVPSAASTPTCRTAGIIAPVTGVIGSLQAAEVIKLVLGMPDLRGRLLTVDIKDASTRALRFVRDPHCPTCRDDVDNAVAVRDADYVMAADEED